MRGEERDKSGEESRREAMVMRRHCLLITRYVSVTLVLPIHIKYQGQFFNPVTPLPTPMSSYSEDLTLYR